MIAGKPDSTYNLYTGSSARVDDIARALDVPLAQRMKNRRRAVRSRHVWRHQ